MLQLCSSVNQTAPTAVYTLSLHDALPIYRVENSGLLRVRSGEASVSLAKNTGTVDVLQGATLYAQGFSSNAGILNVKDRKSTRLNSSHVKTSYAVFCLKKKKRYSRKGATR